MEPSTLTYKDKRYDADAREWRLMDIHICKTDEIISDNAVDADESRRKGFKDGIADSLRPCCRRIYGQIHS